jgi:hypothetical protein
MKKYFIKPAILLTGIILLLASCSKSSVDPVAAPGSGVTAASLTATLTAGRWVLSSFTQKTEDKTSKFTDITFMFAAGGTVTATKNGVETQGSWQYTPAVTYYGSTSKAAMVLNMGATKPFDLLSKTWNFISATNTTVKVDSPEILEDEHVQFSKK